MGSKIINMKNELKDLSVIMLEVESRGMKGSYAMKWYVDIKVIIDSRMSELNQRIEIMRNKL